MMVALVITSLWWRHRLKTKEKLYQKQLSLLRHDVKGCLTPALLMTDRILLNRSADQKIIQSAETIIESIEKTVDYLNTTKNSK